MDTRFALCVPFKSDKGGVRDDLWAWCRNWWAENFPGVYLMEGYVEVDGQFCRSHSINHVVREAGDWDVYVVADADTIMTDAASVVQSVAMAVGSHKLVYSHEQRWMLGPMDTAHLMSHGVVAPVQDPETTGPHPNTYSGVFAINAGLWNRVGGFDERFIGWGYEDWAFMWACSTLGEISRAPGGECMHLWHPRNPDEESGQPHFKENEALFFQYKDAAYRLGAMEALLQR